MLFRALTIVAQHWRAGHGVAPGPEDVVASDSLEVRGCASGSSAV